MWSVAVVETCWPTGISSSSSITWQLFAANGEPCSTVTSGPRSGYRISIIVKFGLDSITAGATQCSEEQPLPEAVLDLMERAATQSTNSAIKATKMPIAKESCSIVDRLWEKV